MQIPKFEKRTDLAIEVRESFPQDNIEIDGVALYQESYEENKVKMTTVEIKNEQGANQMKKPIGTYITLEFEKESKIKMYHENDLEHYSYYIFKGLQKILDDIKEKSACKCHTLLVSGLGNRFATPDALGPYVLENIPMNRHFEKETQLEYSAKMALCGISPGVMSQTGMETSEILQGIVQKVKPDVLLVIDSLASRSVSRLCRTVQITNTGISPGAGIGNNRNQINQQSMGIPVVAIGVPTVVDAGTIIYESLENALTKEGYQENEINTFYQSITSSEVKNLFVTPKDIDEEIRNIGKLIALGIIKITT